MSLSLYGCSTSLFGPSAVAVVDIGTLFISIIPTLSALPAVILRGVPHFPFSICPCKLQAFRLMYLSTCLDHVVHFGDQLSPCQQWHRFLPRGRSPRLLQNTIRRSGANGLMSTLSSRAALAWLCQNSLQLTPLPRRTVALSFFLLHESMNGYHCDSLSVLFWFPAGIRH